MRIACDCLSNHASNRPLLGVFRCILVLIIIVGCVGDKTMKLAQHARRYAVNRHASLAFISPALGSGVARQQWRSSRAASNNALLATRAADQKPMMQYSSPNTEEISHAIYPSLTDLVSDFFS